MESKVKLENGDLVTCDDVWVRFSTGTPVPTLADLWDSKFSRKKNEDKPKYFWALQGISFSLKKGEILGLIGNNGAGKSTLLRVIAEILPPDKGSVKI
ncbi:MAG: ATP-binding cassette domain-containing protein, partial [Patescibacteria group bacterium]|nr:ATP-binding cassette domain-containing protein [Patescibacteria group bacterium]